MVDQFLALFGELQVQFFCVARVGYLNSATNLRSLTCWAMAVVRELISLGLRILVKVANILNACVIRM